MVKIKFTLDRRTDRQTDMAIPIYPPPPNFVCGGIMNLQWTKQSKNVASSVRFITILYTRMGYSRPSLSIVIDYFSNSCLKIINHHTERRTRVSHPCVQDLQHPRLSKPCHVLQILGTRMGFPHLFLNVYIYSISLCISVWLQSRHILYWLVDTPPLSRSPDLAKRCFYKGWRLTQLVFSLLSWLVGCGLTSHSENISAK